MGFRLTLPLDAPGHAYEHGRRCLSRPPVAEGFFRGPSLSGITPADTSADLNRKVHRCLLVIRDATVEVEPVGSGAP